MLEDGNFSVVQCRNYAMVNVKHVFPIIIINTIHHHLLYPTLIRLFIEWNHHLSEQPPYNEKEQLLRSDDSYKKL